MRLVIAFLLAATTVGGAAAQQDAKEKEEMLRQRLLIQERINKGWDVQMENARDRIEGRCKGEARRRYSALHPLKRRKFIKDCIARARR